MALIESILRSLLVADTAVAAVVSTRIYYKRLPREPTFPAIVYYNISAVQDSLTGIARPRMQYDCIAETAVAAKELANKVKDALHGDKHRGVYDGARISFIEFAGMHDDTEEDDTELDKVPVDFFVTYMET